MFRVELRQFYFSAVYIHVSDRNRQIKKRQIAKRKNRFYPTSELASKRHPFIFLQAYHPICEKNTKKTRDLSFPFFPNSSHHLVLCFYSLPF